MRVWVGEMPRCAGQDRIGAAGIISAVLQYYMNFMPRSGSREVDSFLLAATAVGAFCKKNASISGAEVGCQVEVGPACAMASVKTTNAAQLALRGDGVHAISLGQVIPAMRDTGRDVLDNYKETSRGGLAVSLSEC